MNSAESPDQEIQRLKDQMEFEINKCKQQYISRGQYVCNAVQFPIEEIRRISNNLPAREKKFIQYYLNKIKEEVSNLCK